MSGNTLVFTSLSSIPHIEPGVDLAGVVMDGLQVGRLTLQDGDVIVLAQKIVSKSEGRLVDLKKVTPSPEALRLASLTGKEPALVQVILSESEAILRQREATLIAVHRLGFVCANAGIDRSNVRGDRGRSGDWVLLLPEDPDRSARQLRDRLRNETGAEVGVLIIDSHGRAWRMGTVGVCIGAAGFPALLDLRGRPDLFGDPLKITQVGLADEIAAGASALMGQAGEGRPIIHVRGVPYPLREGRASELIRPEEDDLFR